MAVQNTEEGNLLATYCPGIQTARNIVGGSPNQNMLTSHKLHIYICMYVCILWACVLNAYIVLTGWKDGAYIIQTWSCSKVWPVYVS